MGVSDVAKGCLFPHLSVALPLPLLQPADDTQWHPKLSGYLYRNTSCLKPTNEYSWREDCLNANSVIKLNILGNSWINHLLWISYLCSLLEESKLYEKYRNNEELDMYNQRSKVYVKLVCYLIGAGGCVSVGLFFTTLSRGWAGELCPLLDNTGNTKNCGVFQHWRSAKVWPAQ